MSVTLMSFAPSGKPSRQLSLAIPSRTMQLEQVVASVIFYLLPRVHGIGTMSMLLTAGTSLNAPMTAGSMCSADSPPTLNLGLLVYSCFGDATSYRTSVIHFTMVMPPPISMPSTPS